MNNVKKSRYCILLAAYLFFIFYSSFCYCEVVIDYSSESNDKKLEETVKNLEKFDRFSNWDVSLYNKPILELKNDKIFIEGKGEPAGIFFKAPLKHDSSKLKIVGSPIKGKVVVRVRIDDGEMQYFQGPSTLENSKIIYLLPGKNAEILIYSDEQFAFELKDLSLEKDDLFPFFKMKYPDWDISFYNTPKVKHKDNSIYVDGEKNTGVFFKTNVRLKNFKVIINAQVKEDIPLSLRVKYLSQDKAHYSILKNGDNILFFRGHKDKVKDEKIEILIYGEREYEAVINDICILSDDDDFSEEQLKDKIKKEMPGLEKSLIDRPLDAAALLLQWSVYNSNYGPPQILALEKKECANLDVLDAAQIYSKCWEPGDFGGSCGSFAVFYSKVLKSFGFCAFPINFGYPLSVNSHLTHVSTIIALKDKKNKYQFYLFDPTLNGFYVKNDKSYATLDEVLFQYKHKKKKMKFNARKISKRYVNPIARKNIVEDMKKNHSPEMRCKIHENNDKIILCENLNYSVDLLLNRIWGGELKKVNFSADKQDLMMELFLQGMYFFDCSEDPVLHKSFKEFLARNNIKIHKR